LSFASCSNIFYRGHKISARITARIIEITSATIPSRRLAIKATVTAQNDFQLYLLIRVLVNFPATITDNTIPIRIEMIKTGKTISPPCVYPFNATIAIKTVNAPNKIRVRIARITAIIDGVLVGIASPEKDYSPFIKQKMTTVYSTVVRSVKFT
jgi:hypothetical protein